MKPDTTPAPDENPPPKRPISDGEKRTEPGEADLWDFDDDDEPRPYQPSGTKKIDRPAISLTDKRTEDDQNPTTIPISPRGPRRDSLPFKQTMKKPADGPPASSPEQLDLLATAAAEKDPAASKSIPVNSGTKVEQAFNDLDTVEKKNPRKEILDKKTATPEPEEPKASEPEPATGLEAEAPAAEPQKITLPTAAAISKSLSGVEKIGLLAFLIILLGGAFFFLAQSLNKLPEKKEALTVNDFPIKGAHIEATKIATYWRAPITSGEGIESVRRGTVLLPVIELGLNGGPAAVRIFFRNSAGERVGDGVTRAVNGSATLKIAATAGFDDLGMHAAYRTGDTEPWMVEVLEAPSTSASGSDFKTLFQFPISTDRR